MLRKLNSEMYVFFSMSVLYGLFGTPIPKGFSFVELYNSVGIAWLLYKSVKYSAAGRHLDILLVCAIYMIIVPTFFGLVIYQNEFQDFIRDFLPIVTFLMPIWMRPIVEKDVKNWGILIEGCIFLSGAGLAIRYFASAGSGAFNEVIVSYEAPLNQCPSVIFVAISPLVAACYFKYSTSVRIMLFFISFLCFATLAMAVMRAQVFLVAFFWLIGMVFLFKNDGLLKGAKYFFGGSIALIFVYIFYFDQIYWASDMMMKKTESAGLLNARDAEFMAVKSFFEDNYYHTLFGAGWGAEMYLPTAAGIVRFTHNGLLFFIWKTGLIGFIVLLLMICRGIVAIINYLRMYGALAFYRILGLLGSVIVFGIIEMGYKMLMFGVILTLLMVSGKEVKFRVK